MCGVSITLVQVEIFPALSSSAGVTGKGVDFIFSELFLLLLLHFILRGDNIIVSSFNQLGGFSPVAMEEGGIGEEEEKGGGGEGRRRRREEEEKEEEEGKGGETIIYLHVACYTTYFLYLRIFTKSIMMITMRVIITIRIPRKIHTTLFHLNVPQVEKRGAVSSALDKNIIQLNKQT